MAGRGGSAAGRCEVRREGDRATLTWPCAPGESGRLTLDLRPGRPLFERLEIVEDASARSTTLAEGVDPATFVVVGSRENPPPTPPGMSVFNVFFDNPAKRPHQAYASKFEGKEFRVLARGRGSVAVGPVAIGPFRGELVVTVYAGARLIHVEAVVSTTEERRAFTYDAGLVGASPIGKAPGLGGHRRGAPPRAARPRRPRPARGRPPPGDHRRGRRRLARLLPAAASVLLPEGLDRQPQDRLARPGAPGPGARASASASASPRPAAATTSPGSTPRRGPSSGSASSTC